MNKKVLITGGAGFIGSHLAEQLVADDCEVIILDDLSTGNAERVPSGALLHVGCVTDGISGYPLFDEVWHFASPASPDDFRNWQHILRANVDGLIAVSGLVKPNGLLVIASSSEAYGRTSERMSEDNTGDVLTQSVRAVYDESKRMMEAVAWQIQQDMPSLRIIVPRIFNTYGPHMPDDGRVINTFVAQAKAGEILTVHGDGSQTRSFCYIDDLVDILMRLASSCEGVSDSSGPLVVNCGCDLEVSVEEVAQMVLQSQGSGSSLISYTQDFRQNDPMWRRPDLSRLRSIIGITLYTSLNKGIDKCFF